MPPAPNPSDIYCPRCGAANDAALPQCLLCGTPLTAPGRGRAAVPPLTPPAPPPYTLQPEQVAYPPAPAPVPAPPPAVPAPGYHVPQAPPYLPAGYVPHPPPGYVPRATPPPGPPPPAPSPYAGYPPPGVPLPHRTGLRIGVALGLLFSVCVITLLSGSALAVIWGGSLAPVIAPPLPDSTLLLDQAADAHARLKSVHYQLTAEFPGTSGGSDMPRQVMMDGDVVFPDSYTMHSTVYGERIVLGDTIYRRAAGSATWQRVGPDTPDQNAPVSATDLLTVVKYYDTADPAEDVISGTRRLARVHFTVDTQRMAADEGPDAAVAALAGSDVQATALIDEATRYITRLTLRIVTPDNERGNFTLVLSRFDAPVTIKPPPNSSP
jgi:hypothetical protein